MKRMNFCRISRFTGITQDQGLSWYSKQDKRKNRATATGQFDIHPLEGLKFKLIISKMPDGKIEATFVTADRHQAVVDSSEAEKIAVEYIAQYREQLVNKLSVSA